MSYPLPPPAEWQQLQSSGDLRLLRRVPPVERWELAPATGGVVRAAIVDCETTGLADDDEIIELAIIPFEYDKATGRVTRVLPAYSGLRQPSKPIPASATAVHRITDETVAGKTINMMFVMEALIDVQLVIAHSARYDRPMTERLAEVFKQYPWACSCDEIDWRGIGFSSRSLEHVLLRQGWFFSGHRALDDAMATLFLLTLNLPTGESALSALLANARKPQYVVRVSGTKFDDRDALKGRDYAWDAPSKTWWKTTTDLESENAWWDSHKATLMGSLNYRRVSPVDRYSDRVKP